MNFVDSLKLEIDRLSQLARQHKKGSAEYVQISDQVRQLRAQLAEAEKNPLKPLTREQEDEMLVRRTQLQTMNHMLDDLCKLYKEMYSTYQQKLIEYGIQNTVQPENVPGTGSAPEGAGIEDARYTGSASGETLRAEGKRAGRGGDAHGTQSEFDRETDLRAARP